MRITLALAEYPILCDRIREKLRTELFNRSITSSQDFEAEVREYAIRSQKREGLEDPFVEEPTEIWETRQQRVRDHLTDFYFATNLPYELFEQITRRVLAKRGAKEDVSVTFNPELAPKYMLFEQARKIERLPAEKRVQQEALLQEIKVVLIRAMISDQLAYVRIAKEWFTIDDLEKILRHKIGYGKIGGKAAGMLLAISILRSVADEEIKGCVSYPESYFLGADLMYTFMTMNGLMHWNDQKYKTEEEIRADYTTICQEYLAGEFPSDILDRLGGMMKKLHGKPLIVRSSSQLEDNFDTSFAGKYDSYFCPNQGTPEENLDALTRAIANIYASTLNPDALLYRRSKGLQDYDERMAILIQAVDGGQVGKYFLPHAAGVAFSRNLYRWSQQIRREDGFIRLVWGLGTRAVDRVGNDYPRIVALSHPTLRPEASPQAVRRYSQQYVDLINLEKNEFQTLPVHDVLTPRYEVLRYLAQIYKDGFLSSIRSVLIGGRPDQLILTFDELLRRTTLPDYMRRILKILEEYYELPVDMEFTIRIRNPNALKPEAGISIVQCRPQSHLQDSDARLPSHISDKDIVFSTRRMVPRGYVGEIDYVLFVPPEAYYTLPTQVERTTLARTIGRLNKIMKNENFICVGPGRWGTRNSDLGVSVGYADIYRARALVEVTGDGVGPAPEPSLGTHFFQDLMESNTYPLAIYLADTDVVFNRDFFHNSPSCLSDFLPEETLSTNPYLTDCLRLIDVSAFRSGHHLDLIMDDEQRKAVAFLVPN
ncbi:MAG: PEP/pyruvate-binding domain-containing protein [Anaerolineales bacterium]